MGATCCCASRFVCVIIVFFVGFVGIVFFVGLSGIAIVFSQKIGDGITVVYLLLAAAAALLLPIPVAIVL
jgi:hypothetical protein